MSNPTDAPRSPRREFSGSTCQSAEALRHGGRPISTRFAALVILGAILLLAACGSTSVVPSDEATAPIVAAPTPSPSAASSGSGQSAGPSVGPPIKPLASDAIESTGFTSTVDNRWFPLAPGTKLTYQGTKDGKRAIETVTVTSTTKRVDGVECVAIDDTLSFGGVATEKVIGYYAQDREGNVWSFGEDTQSLDANGHVVSTEGSWRAGIDKAPRALFMEGTPVVGHSFADDYTKNDFAILSLGSTVKVPYGSYNNALVTKEWSPLEPDVETHKFYVPGVGLVRDVAVKGPTEELVLVKVERT